MSGGASGRQVGLYGWRVTGWGWGGDNRQMQVTCLGFATACVPNDKHRVSNLKQLLQLHNLQHEAVLCLQLELHNALLDDLGDKAEDGAGRRPLVWPPSVDINVTQSPDPRSFCDPQSSETQDWLGSRKQFTAPGSW